MIERIEQIISNNGLTAKEFANKLGIAPSKITDWRSGKTNPTIKDIIGISQIFNISTDYLLLGKEPTQQSSVSDDSIANDTTVKLVMQLDPFDKAEIRGMARQMLAAPKYQEEDDGYYIGRVAGFGGLPQEIKVPKENHDEIIRLTEKIIAEQNKKGMKHRK